MVAFLSPTQYGGYGGLTALVATAQLFDLAWMADPLPICSSAWLRESDILSTAWALAVLFGWFSAWDMALAWTVRGQEDKMSLLAALNPIGAAVALPELLLEMSFRLSNVLLARNM